MKELLYLFTKKSDIDEIFAQTLDILTKEYNTFLVVRKQLRETDECESKIDIQKEDKKINRFQMQARRKIFTELAVSGVEDLNAGLILMCILTDVERIGDYFKNIVELAKSYPKKLLGGEIEEIVQQVEQNMIKIFELTLAAFKDRDEDIAREAMEKHGDVTGKIHDALNKLLKNQVGGLNPGEAVAVTLYLRFLKRITSHLTNIASSFVNPLERIGYSE
jgi:phosphate uptake regulator